MADINTEEKVETKKSAEKEAIVTGWPTVWTKAIEIHMASLMYGYRILWKVREPDQLGDAEWEELVGVCDSVNRNMKCGFTKAMFLEKWLEMCRMFEIKYIMNGYTIEDRGQHCRRDGSLKDNLSESWVLFDKLTYLQPYTYEKVKNKRDLEDHKQKLLERDLQNCYRK